MRADFIEKYLLLEEKHWWFSARREIILTMLRKYCAGGTKARILEIGCSGGMLSKTLLSHGYNNYTGIDISWDAINICRRRGIKNVLIMNGAISAFKDGSFDVIIASDVLEHIFEDSFAIKEWHRILHDGGITICFVPAYNSLWSSHDQINMHYRRYNKHNIQIIFVHNGFEIVRSSYWNFVLFFPLFIYRLLERLRLTSAQMAQLRHHSSLINNLFAHILTVENLFLRLGLTYPFGASVFVVAKK